MKSDARLLLNKKKWKKQPGNNQSEIWKSSGTVDARKILNLKRSQKSKPPVYGSYMRTKTATSLIASQIRKEIAPVSKVPDKKIQLSKDGNIIITSKSKNAAKLIGREQLKLSTMYNTGTSYSTNQGNKSMQVEPSIYDMDDLEHTAVDDVLDFDSLPPAFATAKSLQNLSRKTALSQVLDKKYTMVADQLPQSSSSCSAKVYASNLHPTVSREDVMELFGNVGFIRGIEMSRPGAAVIDFYDENDAAKACDIYHNRLLDGLPMKCYLQNSDQQQKFTISQRLGQRMLPYISTSQVASESYQPASMSTNSRSRYHPRNVQFTVKLT